MARRARRGLITAVDTSVLIDLFAGESEHGPAAREAIARCLDEGGLVACEVVWTEVAAGFASVLDAGDRLDRLGVRFSPLDRDCALLAAETTREYPLRGGTRERVVADFLIGAHATRLADRLLTRDRGFFRSYFTELTVEVPSTVGMEPRQ